MQLMLFVKDWIRLCCKVQVNNTLLKMVSNAFEKIEHTLMLL